MLLVDFTTTKTIHFPEILVLNIQVEFYHRVPLSAGPTVSCFSVTISYYVLLRYGILTNRFMFNKIKRIKFFSHIIAVLKFSLSQIQCK